MPHTEQIAKLLGRFHNIAFRAWRALSGYDILVLSSERGEGYAAALEGQLRRAGFRVFRDGAAAAPAAARRSRMLVAIATEDAPRSTRVRAGIDAYLAGGGARRMAAVLFGSADAPLLPESFAALKTYRGIRADPADLDPPAVRADVVEQIVRSFRAARTAVLRLVAAGVLAALIAAGYWTQAHFRTTAETRDEWLRRYDAARIELRNDLAEIAAARAAESAPDNAAELLDRYREARARRYIVPAFRLRVPRSYVLLRLGDQASEPDLVLRDSEDGSEWLDAANQRTLVFDPRARAKRPLHQRRIETRDELRRAVSYAGRSLVLRADGGWLQVSVEGRAAARYPLVDTHPVRLLVSPEGRFAAVQGGESIVVWKMAEPWAGGGIPAVPALSEELAVVWEAGEEPEYRIPSR